MIQISLTKFAEQLAAAGIDLAEHPELATQVMVFNQMAATNPNLDLDSFRALTEAFLPTMIPTDDAPQETTVKGDFQ